MGNNRRIDRASRLIHASAEAVYAAFADPVAWQKWLPPTGMTCEIELFNFRTGGEYRLTLMYTDTSIPGKSGQHRDISNGTFEELIPSRRMVQLVEFESDQPKFAGTMRMTWSIDPVENGVNVSISAEDVPEGISQDDHETGLESTLENLAQFIENKPS